MRNALLELLSEMPLEVITGALVAERAKVGYATYFRHYADVRDLLVDTVTCLADELAERMLPSMRSSDTGGAALVLIKEIAQRRGIFLALFNGAGDATRGLLTRHIVERVSALPDLSPDWLPRRLAVRFAVMGTIEILDWWLRDDPERELAEVARLLDRLVIAEFSKLN